MINWRPRLKWSPVGSGGGGTRPSCHWPAARQPARVRVWLPHHCFTIALPLPGRRLASGAQQALNVAKGARLQERASLSAFPAQVQSIGGGRVQATARCERPSKCTRPNVRPNVRTSLAIPLGKRPQSHQRALSTGGACLPLRAASFPACQLDKLACRLG